MSEELRRVEIHLGTLCNNRCVFCVSGHDRDQKEPWAPFSRVQEELRHFYERGCRAAGFLGGEPTVYPRIVEAVACAKELGYERIALCTNGTRMSDRAFCEALVEAGLTRATISIHSHRADVEDGVMTRVPGNHARKLAAIANLVALREKGRLSGDVSLNPVLCRPNLGELDEYLGFFAARGVRDVRFNYIWPQSESRGEKDWVPAFREAMPRIVRTMLRAEKDARGVRLTFGGIPKCALRLSGASPRLAEYLFAKYMDETGFDPANDVSLATKSAALADRFVWQERKKDVLKTAGPRCAACAEAPRCEGVWSTYAELHGLDELEPVETGLGERHEGPEEQDLLLRSTLACNERCPFCFVPLTGKTPPLPALERELDVLAAERGTRDRLTISGGEPLADPGLPALLEAARRRGFTRFVMQTNAVCLDRPKLLERLVALGATTWLVSFHAHEPALYDEVTGSRGLFERAARGLSVLLARGDCEVTVNVVVNARNYRSLPEIVEGVARRCEGRARPAIYFSTLNEAGHRKAPEWAVDLKEAAGPLREAAAVCARLGLRVARSGGESSFPACLFDDPQAHASPRPLPQGRVRYAEDFSGPEGGVGRAKRPACRECRFDARCPGVPAAYAALFGLGALNGRTPGATRR